MSSIPSIFQACNNVQVNGGSFTVSGRDTNTNTVHYHSGSASNHFGYANNVNTGPNHGSLTQGASQGHPTQPQPGYVNPNFGPGPMRSPGSYPGWPNAPGNPPGGFHQYGAGAPPAAGSPPAAGFGPMAMGPVPPTANPRNPFTQGYASAPQSPPSASPTSFVNGPQMDDDVDDMGGNAPTLGTETLRKPGTWTAWISGSSTRSRT